MGWLQVFGTYPFYAICFHAIFSTSRYECWENAYESSVVNKKNERVGGIHFKQNNCCFIAIDFCFSNELFKILPNGFVTILIRLSFFFAHLPLCVFGLHCAWKAPFANFSFCFLGLQFQLVKNVFADQSIYVNCFSNTST